MKSFTGALAAFFSLHIEVEEPASTVPREPAAIHAKPSSKPLMSSCKDAREPARRPLLLLPPHKHPLEDMRRDPRFPKQYDVVIYNRRVPVVYIEGMLQRIFHQRSEYAAEYADHADKICMGAYTLEAAKTKAQQTRKDAKAHGFPWLQVRCRPALKGS